MNRLIFSNQIFQFVDMPYIGKCVWWVSLAAGLTFALKLQEKILTAIVWNIQTPVDIRKTDILSTKNFWSHNKENLHVLSPDIIDYFYFSKINI